MLLKKQKNIEPRRIVQRSPRAKVFSYYQNRTVPEVEPERPQRFSSGGFSLKKRLKYIPAAVAGLVLLSCLVYLSTLDTNPRLQTAGKSPDQKQTVLGDLSKYQKDIQAVLGESIFNRSKLLIDTRKVASQIESEFPELGEVSIIMPLVGRRPIIKVDPATPVLSLATPDGVFVVDGNGKALANLSDVTVEARSNLSHVQDQSGLELARGGIVLPKSTVDFITDLVAQLEHSKLRVKSIVLPPIPAELHLRLDGQPYLIKFNLRGQSRLQTGTFLAVKQRLDAQGLIPANYIDVRVPEKAFYK